MIFWRRNVNMIHNQRVKDKLTFATLRSNWYRVQIMTYIEDAGL